MLQERKNERRFRVHFEIRRDVSDTQTAFRRTVIFVRTYRRLERLGEAPAPQFAGLPRGGDSQARIEIGKVGEIAQKRWMFRGKCRGAAVGLNRQIGAAGQPE